MYIWSATLRKVGSCWSSSCWKLGVRLEGVTGGLCQLWVHGTHTGTRHTQLLLFLSHLSPTVCRATPGGKASSKTLCLEHRAEGKLLAQLFSKRYRAPQTAPSLMGLSVPQGRGNRAHPQASSAVTSVPAAVGASHAPVPPGRSVPVEGQGQEPRVPLRGRAVQDMEPPGGCRDSRNTEGTAGTLRPSEGPTPPLLPLQQHRGCTASFQATMNAGDACEW